MLADFDVSQAERAALAQFVGPDALAAIIAELGEHPQRERLFVLHGGPVEGPHPHATLVRRGNGSGVTVHDVELAAWASAPAVVVHNHPPGHSAAPSDADQKVNTSGLFAFAHAVLALGQDGTPLGLNVYRPVPTRPRPANADGDFWTTSRSSA